MKLGGYILCVIVAASASEQAPGARSFARTEAGSYLGSDDWRRALIEAGDQAGEGSARCGAWGGIEGPNGLVSDTLHTLAHRRHANMQSTPTT